MFIPGFSFNWKIKGILYFKAQRGGKPAEERLLTVKMGRNRERKGTKE